MAAIPTGPYRLVAALLVAALALGCSTQRPGALPAQMASGEAAAGRWHSLRFAIHWPEGDAPRWHMGALLANEVIAPALRARHDDIVAWRFHRRAARDGAGHRFTFLFFATSGTADRIERRVRDNPILRRLIASGAVAGVERTGPGGASLAETSDDRWPADVRAAWPYFIQGVSRSWLELVRRRAAVSDERDLDSRYRAVHRHVTNRWRRQGRHAYLHHLNALFGYVPIEFPLRF